MNKQFLFLPAILVVVLTFTLIIFANLVSGAVSGQAVFGPGPVQQVGPPATPTPVESGDEISSWFRRFAIQPKWNDGYKPSGC